MTSIPDGRVYIMYQQSHIYYPKINIVHKHNIPIMNIFRTFFVIGLAFFTSSIQVKAKSSKSSGNKIQSDSKSGKGSTIIPSNKDAVTAVSGGKSYKEMITTTTKDEFNNRKSDFIDHGMSMMGKSEKSDAAYNISVAKSTKSDVAYDMNMAKISQSDVASHMSVSAEAYLRGGKAGKTTKQSKAQMSLEN